MSYMAVLTPAISQSNCRLQPSWSCHSSPFSSTYATLLAPPPHLLSVSSSSGECKVFGPGQSAHFEPDEAYRGRLPFWVGLLLQSETRRSFITTFLQTLASRLFSRCSSQLSPTQEPYDYEKDVNDARSERTAPQLATDGFVNCPCSYKVREGDTLTSVAHKFKVSVQSIATVNEIANADYVPAGKILLIPHDFMKTGEVVAKAGLPSSVGELQPCEDRSVVQTERSLSELPALTSAFHFQSWHVRLALLLVLLVAISSLVKRYISRLRTRRHEEFVQYQVQREVQESYHQPKLRRWQGILDVDRKVDEVDGDLLAESRAVDVEEENLRQTYAQLESAYVKFLADSGLSKSGYWRGGLPPALEEK